MAHCNQLETGLGEVAKMLSVAIGFFDLDITGIFQINSIAIIDLNALSQRAARWAGNPTRFEEWARLSRAVLFTRARVRCEVFVSFDPGDINLERTTGEGPRVLKRFLRYAENGILQEFHPTGADFDSPFEAAVAEAIESFGYKADTQVGSAGFECDGATYHAALWARERDRLRQQILEGLGWRFHRIWSTDWFYRRAGDLEKLKRVLDAALAEEIPVLPTLLTPPETTPGCVQRPTSKLPMKQRANRQSK